MSKKIFLAAGERFKIEKNLAQIFSGKIEVYAVMRGEGSFRQEFLAAFEKNSAAFPALDEFEQIEILLYAVEDSEIEISPFEELPVAKLKTLMQKWFSALVKVSWLELLADRGDDILISWRDENFLADCQDFQSLLEKFQSNEIIFSMLIGVRFGAEDKKFSRRVKVRERNQRRLVDNAIANLFGEENFIVSENLSQNEKLEEATFIIRRVAQALKMPTENIKIAPELTKKLDQIRLLRRLIQKGNMQMRLIELVPDWYEKDSGVIIGYFGEEKTLAAFIPIAPGSYKLVTKNLPAGKNIDAKVAAKISKDAFECYAGFPARKLKIFDLLKFIFNQCWAADYKTVIAVGLFSGLIPLVAPIITETIFADIIPILDRQGLATVTQVMLVTSFTMASLGIVRTIAVMRITTRINMATEAALWGRLLSLPTKFFRQFTTGKLASRMTGMDVIKGLVSPEFIGGLFGFIFSFWSIFLMCYYSLKLAAVAIGVWLVYVIITAFIYRRVIGFNRNLIEARNKESGTIQQIFSGLAKFREHGAERNAYYLWSKVFGETWNWNLKLRWQGNYNLIIGSVQPFILSMALYYIALFETENINYAQFIAFQAAFTAFNATLNAMIPLVGQYFSIQPHIENFRPILQEEPESLGDKPDAGILSGTIEVTNLRFSYVEGKEILHGLNFKIGAGENVAIVGKSGCGKSTLVRLLLGFETPKSGAILFDGQDLAEINLPSIRSQMGVVLQNGQLMQGDIFTNIIGTNALTLEDAWEAAEAAGVADDIDAMPMGMQTVISENSSNISGGQRQRILIARALVTKPAILIFDEATSALDNRTQAIVTKSLDNLQATRIIVAHRLSTIRNCDRIIVMDAGNIVETGTFEELIQRGGIFANLVKRQLA